MKSRYTFSFKEINYGSVVIESDHQPDASEVIDAIMSGSAYYKDTEFEDISLTETERPAPKKDRGMER